MALTITIPGAVEATIGATAPAVLTIGVGTPGATGPQGPAGAAGVGVPVGGTAGQFLTKIDSTNYNTDWTTVNLSAYAVKANNLSDLADAGTARTNLGLGSLAVVNDAPSNGSQYARKNAAWEVVTTTPDFISSVSSPLSVTTGNLSIDLSAYLTSATASATYQTLAGMSSYLTTATAASTYYLQTNPSGFQTAGDVTTALSPYLLSATAASTYAVIAAGQPTAGTTGQVLTKNSGTNYDSSWTTIIPGDRYLTSSTTSNTVSNGNKTFTIGTGLSYTPTQNITISYDASNHMHGEVLTYDSGTGVLTVDINNHTGTGTYASWVVNVGGVTPATSVAWGAITGTLSSQTDLQSALDLKLAATTAAATYLPLSGGNMPAGSAIVVLDGGIFIYETVLQNSGLLIRDSASTPLARFQADEVLIPSVGITFSDATVQTTAGISAATVASTYAPLASPALTGNVTISSSTGAALFIQQTGTGNILTLHDQASDTTFVAIDANGKVSTIASEATNGAGFNIAHGVAPTSPVNGDIWTTTSGVFARINAGTQQLMSLGNTQTVSGSITFSNASQTLGNSTATGTINVASGATISASTKTVNVATGGVSGSTTLTTIGPVLGASTTSIGNTTAASTLNLATGATLTATTKAVNIGTAGVAGSTTNITIGSTTGTSTTTLQGITNGVTEAVDTNNTELATTAFVVGQASSTTPLADGTAAVGTSLRYARADHVHPSSGGGGGTDYQAYTTPGTYTWTKPANAKWVEVYMFGGGGGGGSGARVTIATQRGGGGGGSGGGFVIARMAASSLAATQTVVVGAGGTAGVSTVTNDSNGSAGGAGGNTTFSIFTAIGGGSGGGGGGSGAGGAAGTSRSGYLHGSTISTFTPIGAGGAGTSTTGNNGQTITANQAFSSSGGGGGAGAAAASIVSAAGGAGGSKTVQIATQSGTGATAGGAGGTTAGVSPTAGVSGLGLQGGGTGGGGGAYITAVAGMAGATGGAPGGGGGGGSVSDNGFASGAGGAGGSGAIYIITYC